MTGDLNVRFYAGAPLIAANGDRLDTLCIIDHKPRPPFSNGDIRLLKDLAAIAVDEIELRYAAGHAHTESRKQTHAEAGIAAAEFQLSLFSENAPVAVALFDRELRYLGASRRWLEMLNIDDRDFIGRNKYDLSRNLPEEWREQDVRTLNGEAFVIEEDRLPTPDGGFHWVHRQLCPWKDESGGIGGFVAYIEIIDERKAVMLELERSRYFVNAVLDNIQDGIVACDAEGRLTLFNEATRRFHGVDSESVRPDEWASRYDLYEQDAKTPLAMDRIPLYHALNGETVQGQEIVIAPPDAEQRKIVAYGAPMFDAQGRKLGAVATMHDVTNEYAARDKWREVDARYRAIFNRTFQFCGLLDLNGALLEANDTALQFGGFSRDAVIGKPFWSTPWWPEDEATQTRLKKAIAEARGGAFVRYEVDVYGEGRALTPIDFSVKPVTDGAGAVTSLIVEGRDISDLREMNEVLRRNQAELELILNNVPIIIFYKDDKNRIIRLNETAAKSLNSTVRDVDGKNTYDLYPEHAAKHPADDLQVINSGNPKLGIIEEYETINGDKGWVRTDKVPYIDPETGERFAFLAATDITAEKIAEEALRDTEARYRDLYRQTPVMLHSIDPQGDILSVSDFWLEQLGYTRVEAVGRKISDFMSPDSAVRHDDEDFPEFLRSGVCKDIEYQFITKSGETVDVLMSAVAEYDEAGTMSRSMAVLTDITERKAVEQQFIQAQKMESVGQLTGGLAHDFNNLLGVVIGNLQLVERSLERARPVRRGRGGRGKRKVLPAPLPGGADLQRREKGVAGEKDAAVRRPSPPRPCRIASAAPSDSARRRYTLPSQRRGRRRL